MSEPTSAEIERDACIRAMLKSLEPLMDKLIHVIENDGNIQQIRGSDDISMMVACLIAKMAEWLIPTVILAHRDLGIQVDMGKYDQFTRNLLVLMETHFLQPETRAAFLEAVVAGRKKMAEKG